MNDKKNQWWLKWRDDDRYGVDGKKAHGYPLGQPTAFLDGRPVQNAIISSTRGTITALAGLTTDTVAVVRVVPPKRALYLPWVVNGFPSIVTTNVVGTWQLYACGRPLGGGCAGITRADIKAYVPPSSTITFYSRIVNGTLADAYFNYAVYWIEFDSESDAWNWGESNNAPNPVITDLVWP